MSVYIKEKINLLKDFGICLNKKQLAHIRSLTTEIAVDNFAHDLLFGKSGEAPYSISVFNRNPIYLGSRRSAVI